MAKYTVKFSCGHEETIQLYGTMKSRDERIAYMEKHGKCEACKKAEYEAKRAEAHAKAEAEASKYPTLEGSEKQIAWAMDIRQKWVDEVNATLSKSGMTWAQLQQNWDKMSEGQRQDVLDKPVDTHVACKFAHVITETSAKYYIDNRHETIDVIKMLRYALK